MRCSWQFYLLWTLVALTMLPNATMARALFQVDRTTAEAREQGSAHPWEAIFTEGGGCDVNWLGGRCGLASFADGPNLYAYVQQNPWTKLDPEGLYWFVENWSDLPAATVGIGKSVLGFLTAPIHMATHLPETAAGVKQLANHPIDSGHAMVASIREQWASGPEGRTRAATDLVLGLANLGKTVVEAGQLVKRAERTVESSAKKLATKEAGKNFDQARTEAFEKAGMTNPHDVQFTKVDPKTGTVVEFKGKDGAKVAYDGPHPDTPGPSHDTQHAGWQTGGKRNAGGAERGNLPYDGPQHPSRSNVKGDGSVEPH